MPPEWQNAWIVLAPAALVALGMAAVMVRGLR
mgnify:CR=1 FL=1